MNIRQTIRRHVASAAAAVALSAFFVGAAIGPVSVSQTASAQAQLQAA